jgi:molecular chaperone DnaK
VCHFKIQEKTDELHSIIFQIRWRTPKFLLDMFAWLLQEQPKMNDQTQAKSLMEAGHFAANSRNWERLREVNFGLMDLLPHGAKEEITHKIGFGL